VDPQSPEDVQDCGGRLRRRCRTAQSTFGLSALSVLAGWAAETTRGLPTLTGWAMGFSTCGRRSRRREEGR